MKTTSSILPSMIAAVAVAAGVTLEAAEPSSSSGWRTEYPGPAPGRVTITCRGQDITVGNEALSMSWTWTPRGLRARGVLDVQTRHGHEMAGEVFQIILTDGRCYPASTLAPEGIPRVSEVAPDPKAARLAARIPGRRVELPMRASDGRLRVVWRTIGHDDSNYLRQEIELVAAQEDIGIREIVWLNESLPGAMAAGSVDGSPIIMGSHFLGCDDPMATNMFAANSQASCRLNRSTTLRRGERLTQGFIVGVAPEGQMRRAFLYYLERERAHPYRPFLHLDTEAMRRLMIELRQEDPDLYINLTTGSWPSPFWLRYADSLWRQGDDMGFAGKGSKQQQWLTYRDQETYHNVVRKAPLFPLNSLMTQGVAYSRQGRAGEPTFNSAGFKDDVRAFFGSGTGLQELYIQPAKLTAEDWRVLAEAAKWSRASADVLVDTHWIGGDPSRQEVYGYASWSPRKGIVMLRNPDDRPRDFALDVGSALELPPRAITRFTLRSAWAEDGGKPALTAEAGKPLRLTLEPFEVVVLEATPAT